jgi:ATP-dependent helicase/nuclease subunit A
VLRRLDAEDAWRYPFAAATRLVAKATVGELAERVAGEPDGDEEPAEPTDEPSAAGGRRPAAGFDRPRFAAGHDPTPWEVGSAAHLALRHLDLRGPCDQGAVSACLLALQDREMLEPNAARAVDTAALAAFLRSPLGVRLRRAAAAGTLRREVPFSLRIDARDAAGADGLGARAAGEWTLVQGVVDALALEPDGIVVVDFKTDHVAGEAGVAPLLARYGAQVGLYARAASGAYGRPVREAWLAFLAAGLQVPVPVPGGGRGPGPG